MMKNESKKQPNLIYVFADQWRRQAMGFMNEDPVITPNIDRFAAEGIVVDNAISVCPLCSPHRASLLTGNYPFTTGVYTNCKPGLDVALEPTDHGFVNVLKDNGYQTGYIGKWHLDRSELNDSEEPLSGAKGWDAYTPPGPNRQGFEFWYSYGADNDHFHPHYWKDTPVQIKIDQWSVSHETDVAIDYMKSRRPDAPFALFISYNPPHSPYDQVPSSYKAMYDPDQIKLRPNVETDQLKPHTHQHTQADEQLVRETTANYFAAVTGVDAEFGRLLDAVHELGLDGETVIVLSSDHGDMMASHGLMAKHVWYEESIGIPFLVRWPGIIEPGRKDTVIGSPDQMPTILGMMGIEVSHGLDGRDKSHQLLNPVISEDDVTFIGCYPGQPDAIKLYEDRGLDHRAYGWRGIRSKNHTFVIHKGYHPDDAIEILLYDLKNDPYQLKPERIEDISDNTSIQKYMTELNRWLQETGDPFDTAVYRTFGDMVDGKILPHMKSLCEMFYDQRDGMVLDGAACFDKGQDKDFVYGTLVSSFCQVLGVMRQEGEDFERWIGMTREIISENIVKPLNTFGILEFLSGMVALKEIGLYERIVSSDVDMIMRKKLHWNVFINPETLEFSVPRAKNYYGVAIRIALLRERLGFDDVPYSKDLLERFFEKVPVNRDGSVYMDETDGQGRYDKYSLSIASELAELYIQFDRPLPDKVKQMLMHAIEIHLMTADEQGNGCLYGRSIGGNATGTILEVLPLALYFNEVDDKALIHSLIYQAGRRMIEFWFSSKREIFNLWDDGRQTDDYRGKHRILEVNLDLSLKMIRAQKFMEKSGWAEKKPLDRKAISEHLLALPKMNYISFDDGKYDRGLAIYRGHKGVMMLPFISGGKNYYSHSQYMPIPYSYGLVAGSANRHALPLVSRIRFESGVVMAPIVFGDHIKVIAKGDEMHISCQYDELCIIGNGSTDPLGIKGIKDTVSYCLNEEGIERIDTFSIPENAEAFRICMTLDSFSADAVVQEDTVTFGKGRMKQVQIQGMKVKAINDIGSDSDYHTNYGPLQTQLELETDLISGCSEYQIRVRII